MTDRYAVFGHPVVHSKSPFIHRAFAGQTGQDLDYEAIDPGADGFAEAVRRFFAEGGRGANVTLPFKEEALALADEALPRAREAGAANTLIAREGRLLADNTDGAGLVRDLKLRHGVPLAGAEVLLVGAGGAARGVLGPLLRERPQRLVIANRTPARAEALARAFAPLAASHEVALEARPFDALRPPFTLVINATSASLAGEIPPLPSELFAARPFVYDMMYGASPTPFLREAARHGAKTADGLGMLVEQAAESFFLWRGVRPDAQAVYLRLRAALGG
ncbi:MAG: shikimate dehydrogenase [Rhodocyclales bacterium]|nr:shikimate dehydrogenase [Rhodocyclales bacterium]